MSKPDLLEQTASEELQDNPDKWFKLSAISIIFFLSRMANQLFNQALPSLAPLAIVLFNSDNKATTALLILGASILLLISSSVLQYLFFLYQIHEDKILIHEGVFKKQQRVINFEKIQNINILQPFYFKPFKLVTLQLETAGSKNSEANLSGVTQEKAEALKSLILNFQSHNDIKENQKYAPSTEQSTEILSTANTKDLIKYGLTSNGMFWFFVFTAPIYGMLDDIIEKWIGAEKIELLINLLGGGFNGGLVLVISIVFIIFVLMISFSILGSIFRFHNYQLTLNNNTLKRFSGLLSTQEESAKIPKIQAFVNQTNFIGRWLKVENIAIKQASGNQNKQASRNKLFIIPTKTREQTNQLLSIILNLPRLHSNLNKINSRYILKTWLVLMLLPITLTIFLVLSSKSGWPLVILGLGLILWPLINLRWKNFGYAIDENYATFRSGFLGFKRITFLLFKVQRVVIKQSPLQKRRDLATLIIFLASDKITIPYIPIKDAEEWYDRISFKIETTQKNWF